MTQEHATLLLGAYVLDALEPAERREVERHLSRCQVCVAQLIELEPLPRLLSALRPDDLAALDDASSLPVHPSPDLFARMTAAIDAAETSSDEPTTAVPIPTMAKGAEPQERAWPLRRPRLLVAAAVIVLLAGAGAGLAVTRAAGSHHGNSSFSASAGAVRMSVDVSAARQGTTLRVSVAGLPIDEHCTLIAVASDGSRHPAGQWVATYAGTATVTGSTEVARQHLRQLVLLGTDGRALVSVTV
jgi:anti-sigma factor RsiW